MSAQIELLMTLRQPDYQKRYATFAHVQKNGRSYISIGVHDENGQAAVDIPLNDIKEVFDMFDEVRYITDSNAPSYRIK